MFDGKKFYNKVNFLCQERGTTITQFTISIGLGNSAAANWKKGSTPSVDTVILLAQQLNVSTDYLLAEDEGTKHKPLNELEEKWLNLFNQLYENEKFLHIGRLESYLELRDQKQKNL